MPDSRLNCWFSVGVMLSGFFVGFTVAAADLGLRIAPKRGQIVENHIAVVSPDGSGLPIGQGTVAEGRTLYKSKCASCHGGDGKLPGNPLVGGLGSIDSDQPLKTVGSYWPYATTLYDYISVAMPYNQEKSMMSSEIYAVTAFVLYMNEIIPADTSLDQSNLADVLMPNRDGFIELQD